MERKLKDFITIVRIKLKKNKLLVENFSYLSALQIFNTILPLITYPYLIRVLGAELYGLVVFAQAIIAYFSIMINFGFNISATKEIAIHRENKVKLSEIVSSIFIIKISLFLLVAIILIGLILFVPEFHEHYLLYLFSLGLTVNEVIFPIWYFQGIEKMRYITYISIISRLVFTALIFFIIKQESDYILVPLFNTIGSVIGGLVALYFVFIKGQLKISLPDGKIVFGYFKSSTPFFLSRVSAVINIRTNALVIGYFLGYTEVSYYDLASKICQVFKIPFTLINQTIYII